MEVYVLLGFVLILSIYLGLELISKVPSTLHTPLMSGANAISGIALVGNNSYTINGYSSSSYPCFFSHLFCNHQCFWWLSCY